MVVASTFNAEKHCRVLALMFALLGFLLVSLSLFFLVLITVAEAGTSAELESILNGILAICAVIWLLLAVLPLLGCWSVLKRRPWARIFSIVLSALYLPTFPLGTAVGIYGLWVLTKVETEQYLARAA